MRRMLSILALLLLVVSAAYPCGGKYNGRNAILNKPPAVRPASILILNNQGLQVYGKRFTSTLKQLGHKVSVKNSKEFAMALKSKKGYDIVMFDVADMGSLNELLKATASDVVPVPLIPRNSKKAAFSPAEYPISVKLSSKSTMIRKKIEKAMQAKEKEAKEKV